MTVSRIQNVYVVADDVPRVAAFWRDALGLAPRFADGARWVQLQAGNQGFAIASRDEGVAAGRGAVTVLEVDDLEAHAAAIDAAGGRVLARRDMGDHGRVLTFSDPEGNVAQLFQRAQTAR